jgi:hypothetical protein
MYSGNRNEDGVLTKYEGYWDRDKKHGDNGIAVYRDGSMYHGSFKKDHLEGMGKFEWAVGHVYEGPWKESQMEGNSGLLINANGREFKGTFKKNFFLQDKTYINPLDDEKKQAKNIKVYEEQVLSQKDRLAYERRTRVFRIQTE